MTAGPICLALMEEKEEDLKDWAFRDRIHPIPAIPNMESNFTFIKARVFYNKVFPLAQ
jgi:hypothetical protein